MRQSKTLSIVIPAYNEEKFVETILERVIKADSAGLEKEVIVVDDDSRDKTPEILKKAARKYKKQKVDIKIILKGKNEGKGAALKTGFLKSTGDIVLVQDADLEYNPNDYPALLEPFLKENADVVYGSRTLGIKEYNNKPSSLVFYLGGLALTLYINLLYGLRLTDQPTCYKLFRKEIIPLIINHSKEKDFSYEVEITALLAKNGYKIHEVPIRYSPRSVKEGKKINFSDFLKALRVGLRHRFSNGD